MGVVKLSTAEITQYQKYSNFLAGNPAFSPSAFDLLETTVLGDTQASVEFTNLTSKYASTYQHLQLRVVTKSSYTAGAISGLMIQFNGDTASNYSLHALAGNGSNVFVFANSNQTRFYCGINAGNGTANTFGGQVIDILDPFETSKFKTVRTLYGLATNEVGLVSGNWRSTNQITSINLQQDVGSQNFLAGSRFSLYGLKAA